MKFQIIILLAFTTLLSVTAHATDRVIDFAQQDKPGHVVIVSISENIDNAVVSVEGKGLSSVKKQQYAIKSKKFNEYWKVVSSSDLQSYKLSASEGGGVTNTKNYTLRTISNGEITLFRLPKFKLNNAAENYIKNMQSYIQ